MTDKEKLQRLFEAALKDSSEVTQPPTPLFPKPQVALAAAPVVIAPAPAAVTVAEIPAVSVAQAGMTDAASAELGSLLDEQQQRKARKRRREALVTLGVCLTLTGGACGWYVQNPERVQAFREAIRDIRSVGDVASMVAKYQAALDKISVRSNQIDQATQAMGVSTELKEGEDANMEAEMLAMMGGEGKTSGQRNQALEKNFGHMGKKHGVKSQEAAAKLDEADSFDWKR